jgi:hypothetical protein
VTDSRSTRARRRVVRTALFGIAVLAGSACTPQEYIDQLFGAAAPEASRIAMCESTMNPGAVSATNDHGLFQINAVHRGQFEAVTGQPWSAVYDPYWNTVYAKWLYDHQGWSPWACRKAL